MNAILSRALAALVLVVASFGWSARAYLRRRTVAGLLQTLGAGSFIVVVLTHVAEGSRWLPWMHWGEPHSVGHYLDLMSAMLAVLMLALGILLRARVG